MCRSSLYIKRRAEKQPSPGADPQGFPQGSWSQEREEDLQGAPTASIHPTQLPVDQLCSETKHLLQVGAPARPASQLAKPRGLAFFFHYTALWLARCPGWHPRGGSWYRGMSRKKQQLLVASPVQWEPADKGGRSCSLRLTLPTEFQGPLWCTPSLPRFQLHVYACSVAPLCPALSNPMDCSPPGSSVHGIFRQEYWSKLPVLAPQLLSLCALQPTLLNKRRHRNGRFTHCN